MTEEITIRMLGDNVTLTRSSWEELAALLVPRSPHDGREAAELAERIIRRLAESGD